MTRYLMKPSFTKSQSFDMAETDVVDAHASATLQILDSQMTYVWMRMYPIPF